MDDYVIQLSVPTQPAPAYAAAGHARSASTVEEGKRPQYVFASDAQTHAAAAALVGAVQGQYPAYTYPAYGYDPSYGMLLVLLQMLFPFSACFADFSAMIDLHMLWNWAANSVT